VERSAERLDVQRCEALVARVAAGDAAAWRELTALLWPEWVRILRTSRSMGPLARSEDHVREAAARLMRKLGRNDCRAVLSYAPWRSRHPGKSFADWNRIVATNVARSYAADQRGATSAAASEAPEPSRKRLLNELSCALPIEDLGVRPPFTDAQTVRQILEFAQDRLPEGQYAALRLWLEGAQYDEIELELGLAREGAGKRLVRAAVATLRRTFGAHPT
jgi:hypothetical protein